MDSLKKQIAFLTNAQWLDALSRKANPERAAHFQKQLVDASAGMGYCMDERPTLDPNVDNLKPAFIGGAAGWMVMFQLMGQDFDASYESTKVLYAKAGWGVLEGHVDDEHGHLSSQAVMSRDKGCGFLGVWYQAATVLCEVLAPEMSFLQIPKEKGGAEFIQAIRNGGGKIIVLTNDHKTDVASVVVNYQPNKTLDVGALYESETPAFRWDAWKSVNEDTLSAFNQIAHTNITLDQFHKIQAGLHIVTGFLLHAVRLEGEHPNLVIIPDSPMQVVA